MARLGLASAEQVRAVRGRVRRLTRDLPAFESVWVDALAQARLLSPYQAVEINAGRDARLQVGSYIVHQPLRSPGYSSVFRAWDRESRRWVRLSLLDVPAKAAADMANRLKTLVRLSAKLPSESNLLPVIAFGAEGDTAWTVATDARGQTAAEWMVHHGRFPPAAVADIARQMLAGLIECERAEIVHGDLGAGQILLDVQGKVWLPEPGLRPAIRPEEGYGHAALPSEAFDCLAPERVTSGAPADRAGDLYACGCLWWQLLAGRPAIPGATGLAKLRAAQTAKIADIRQIAPDVDDALANAIAQCIERDPKRRPRSFQELAERLGAAPRTNRRALVKAATRSSRSFQLASPIAAIAVRSSRWTTRGIAAAGLLAAVVVGIWPAFANRLGSNAGTSAELPHPSGNAAVSVDGADAAPAVSSSATPAESISAADEVIQASWIPPENVLELDATRPLRVVELPLSAGQTVRGRAGRRPQVVVPPSGWEIDVEDVRFENIDFSCGPAATPKNGRSRAIVRLRAWQASFVGCSFQSTGGAQTPDQWQPAAVEWLGRRAATDDDEMELPTGQLSFERCVFHRVSAAVRCQLDAALVFHFDDVLHLGPGPLIVLIEAPQVDEPVSLAMSHVTLRNAAGLIDCRYRELQDAMGRIAIQASNCALMPAAGKSLFLFRGDSPPEPLTEQLVWSGQGSVLAREAPLALWETAQGRVLAAPEDSIQVEGLVRTEVGFAGDADDGPSGSRIVRWQVPLQSPDPPGIRETALDLPAFSRH